MKIGRRLNRRIWLTAGLLMLVLIGGLVARSVGQEAIEAFVAPPAVQGTPLPVQAQRTDDERAYYQYVGGRLRALTAESAALAKLGNERSRNILELQVRSNRVTELADQIDAYIESTPAPVRFEEALAAYSTGIVLLRSGQSDAISAFMRFDWDAVAVALNTFEQGASLLDQSYLLFRDEDIDVGSPVSSPIAGSTIGVATAV